MNKEVLKQNKRVRRKAKIRAKISGTNDRPRLSVFRSNRSMFVQIIDDVQGATLVSAHSREVTAKKNDKELFVIETELGKILAKKAVDKKIEQVVFDRSGYKYHGRVKAFAEAARAGGLKF